MKIDKLCKSFGPLKLFDNYTVEIPEGRITFISGKSGCGKTTLLNMIAGLEKPDSGSIGFEGKVSYLFQEPRLFDWKSVLDNVSVVSTKEEACKYLKLVKLEDKLKNHPAELSGGQRQRVAIARALAFNTNIVLLDEPFQNLDEKLHDELTVECAKLLTDQKKTVLWVTHDSQEIERVINSGIKGCFEVRL